MRILFLLFAFWIAACGGSEPGADEAVDGTAVQPPTATAGSAPSSTPTPEPATDAPRVVFLGTSLTAGYGLADPLAEAWPARVADLAAADGTPIRVVNGGVSGDTSAGGLRRIVPLLSPAPAAVVLELGANDGLRGLPIDELRSNLDATIDSIRIHAPDAPVVVTRMEPPRNLGAAYVDAFSGVFDSLATRDGVSVTPFLLDGVAAVPELNQRDGIHPVAEGHRRMAATVWPVLRDRLGAGGGGAP
ncbi:MAG TPA: arylesterase [Longimicrobiales bacterium]|nr:arylesterase [Longimicrobiales bacterium]